MIPRPTPHLLVLNAGSSSIKFALYEAGEPLRRLFGGAIERIAQADAVLHLLGETPADRRSTPLHAPTPRAAVAALIDVLGARPECTTLAAAGHRIVHGGPDYAAPQRITPSMLDALRGLTPFDPAHLPLALLLIEALAKRWPDLPQVACFDTAFHRDLPRVARVFAIPRRYEARGVRRYGFHGLSYAYLMQELARLNCAQGRVVLAHLGHGASLAAVHDGHCIDTSMGFTPSSGLPMSTRAGDLDPGLAGYLAHTEHLSAQQFDTLVNTQSGLLGLSETSADLRELLALEARDVRAAEAVAVFCYQAKKTLGAYSAALGGLDTLVFAGGIGEHAPTVRARICAGLEFLGISLDAARNAANADVISSAASRVGVRVIPTDEAQMIARATFAALSPAA